MESLFAEIHPVFQKNDHTAASLLLYPQGFQQDTPSADHEIFTALAGDPFKPGIPGFIPELSAGLYITNGDFTDWAYNTQDTLSFTPEGTPAEDLNVTGFEYPDSPQQIQQEFERHLPFVLDLAHSADDPANPHSHLDNKAADFTVDKFKESYGSPQPVGAVVKRELGKVKMRTASTAKKAKKVSTEDYEGGERYYKEHGVFYHRVRGVVKGTKPGDEVEGVVHRRRREVQVLHLRGRGRDRQPGPDPRRTRTTRACSRIPRRSQGRSTSTTTRTRWMRPGSTTTSTTSTRTTAGLPIRSGSSATTRTSSGTRATTTCRASPMPRAAPASPRARSIRRTPCATS